ncbi:MAG: GNAT family N-acetyltransferase [Desulfobulbaceae bacterium]|nr:GNAT family N-acetyltransferase [Desulfobulbaceae bacterium]
MKSPHSFLVIRPGRQSDLDQMVCLLKKLFTIEKDFTFKEQFQRRGLQIMLANESGCIMVAEAAGEIVGMCSAQLTVSTAEGGAAMLVEDVIVHEDFRRRGVGRQLMSRLAEWGRGKGVSRIQLLADRNNTAALAFYRKLGWQTTELICLRKVES